jgi:GLPGLI family protein
MKTLSKSRIVLFIVLCCSIGLNAQKEFEGQIKYAITYEGMGLNESMKSILPEEMIFILKENKSRSELITGMGDQINIFDGNTKTSINLMDIIGQKIAIRKTIKDLDLDRKKYQELKVDFKDETKEIAGYACKKATIKVNATDFNGESSFNVYYTEDLGNTGINYGDPLFNQINGVMLEYEIKARGLMMRFSASEIKSEAISDDTFSIPEDYKEMTRDELKRLFGNN